jgi:hypothetical protein
MLLIFKMSAVLNIITFEFVTSETGDAEYIGRLCHCFEELCCLHLESGYFLEDGDSVFLSEAFLPMYQITRCHIPNNCVVDIN